MMSKSAAAVVDLRDLMGVAVPKWGMRIRGNLKKKIYEDRREAFQLASIFQERECPRQPNSHQKKFHVEDLVVRLEKELCGLNQF